MLDGYRNGVITEQRLQDALRTHPGAEGLARPAPRRRARTLVPGPEALAVVGSDAHHAVAAAIADKTVTLVKDTQQQPAASRPRPTRGSACTGSPGGRTSPAPTRSATSTSSRQELEEAGFEVHVFKTRGAASGGGRDRGRTSCP